LWRAARDLNVGERRTVTIKGGVRLTVTNGGATLLMVHRGRTLRGTFPANGKPLLHRKVRPQELREIHDELAIGND
jgi:hypothetical protein